jgi:membrane protein
MSNNKQSNLKTWLLSKDIVVRLQQFLKNRSPWGVEGMNLYDVLRFFAKGLMNGSVSIRSAAISYRLLVAVFPAIILLLSILPHTPLKTEEVLDMLEMLFPGGTAVLFEQTVEDLLDKTQGTLLSIGFILTLIYASSSVNALLSGFNASYLIENKDSTWYSSLISIVLLVVLVLMLGFAVLLIGFSGQALSWLYAEGYLPGELLPWLNMVRWGLSLLLVYFSVSILYHFGNPDADKWRTLTPGATMTTILIVIISIVFSAIISYLDSYNRLYGSIGTFLALLVWVNANSSVLLLGFEFNASVHKARNHATRKMKIKNS